jgi:hypothetical protein
MRIQMKGGSVPARSYGPAGVSMQSAAGVHSFLVRRDIVHGNVHLAISSI